RSLGVASVVEGGQTMNPSTQEIFEAVEKLPNDRVIVLPNNKNIIMAAEQARDLCEKQVLVVPTRTIPQGISAVLALNPQADLEANEQSMAEAVRSVRTGEITVATRDVSLSGVEVRKGQVIGLLDDELVVSGEQPEQVVREILKRFDLPDMEIVTLYYGADVSAAEAESLTDQLQEEYPDLEFEVLEGGQPHYFYIISAE
ncbi:MAG: DAK2 domain-containing protein, partial [Anaerolineae bacterium]